MRVLISPTAFKGSFTAEEATAALARGASRALPEAEVRRLPLSDGGPGFLEAVRAAGDAAADAEEGEARGAAASRLFRVEVRDPLGRPAEARILLTPAGEAVVESADACGLHLLAEEERNPRRTHTLGVGDLLRAAAAREAKRVVVGLGGSATCDGGTGAARAFGYRFLDEEGRSLEPGGGELARLTRVERGWRDGAEASADPDVAPEPGPGSRGLLRLLDDVDLVALADVSNPLLGPDGAARTFAPQKGASPEAVERLETGLARLAEVAGRDLPDAAGRSSDPGTGAAGGLGYGLAAFLGARLEMGSEWVLERTGFDGALEGADLVVTGEGAFDRTTGMGKVVGEVIRRARARSVPVALVCGRVGGEVPDGVVAADGEGEWVDADALAELAEGATARAVG